MNKDELVVYLKSLPECDFFREESSRKEIKGDTYFWLCGWKAKIEELVIDTGLTIHIDISYGEFGHVILIGEFVHIDISEAKIGTLDCRRAVIHRKLDRTDGTIVGEELA